LADDAATVVKQIKEASDIVAVVGSYLALHPAGKTFKGLCPFHNDSRPSFTVDPHWQNYKCWSCGKFGDVFQFVQEFEKVGFREALELLARRAGIALPQRGRSENLERRAQMLAVLKWAAERYHSCLLDLPFAEDARHYLGERKLTGETVRQFQLGFAPVTGDWLVRQANDAPGPIEALVDVGLIAKSQQSDGWYDRFRERVIFPIRDVRGQVVGFGGRILPNSHLAARSAKYLNTNETELFKKSDLIYGLDRARLAGQAAGRLAVVEGYTDVLMAHQHGVGNVVATMGTALTALHVRQLRRYAPQIVLVYDADAGGTTGVDRALELFVREDVDLAIATLPEGKDPCDLLVEQGAEPLKSALTDATDALEYKLNQALGRAAGEGVEGTRRAVDAVLGILALVPTDGGSSVALKRELVVGRLAHRFGLRVDSVWKRLDEIRQAARERRVEATAVEVSGETQTAPAEPLERELLEVLLADPELVAEARGEVTADDINHPGLRRLLAGLYDLVDEGEMPELDALRLRIADRPQLADYALRMQDVGRMHADRPAWLKQILHAFRARRTKHACRELQTQLSAADDHNAAVDLLRKLQQRAVAPPV
jgi:DNA primase